jgi:hypothetical protein
MGHKKEGNMESFHKATLIGIISGALLLFGMLTILLCYSMYQDTQRMKAGYEQVATAGSTVWLWHKVK